MNILIINGPNLNFLGKREPEVYGSDTLEDIVSYTESRKPLSFNLTWFQSNIEGEIIDKIQEFAIDSGLDALVINPGGYSHTSVAIHDALMLTNKPKIEVHLSQVYSREEFRHTLLTAKACTTIMSGLGKNSYHAALYALSYILNKDK
jgi:3-dehydroquinate dehydratase-2